MKLKFTESAKEHTSRAIVEWNTIRETFAWYPVYLEDEERYAWLEKVKYHRVADYHWRFYREYFSSPPEPIAAMPEDAQEENKA